METLEGKRLKHIIMTSTLKADYEKKILLDQLFLHYQEIEDWKQKMLNYQAFQGVFPPPFIHSEEEENSKIISLENRIIARKNILSTVMLPPILNI